MMKINNYLHCNVFAAAVTFCGVQPQQNLIVSAHIIVIVRFPFRKVVSIEKNQEYFCSKFGSLTYLQPVSYQNSIMVQIPMKE